MFDKYRKIKVEQVDQWINEDLLIDLEQTPSRIQRWFTNNFIQRGLAYLVALTEGRKATMLKCTGAGVLKTAPTGSGLTRYSVDNGTTVNAFHATQTHEYAQAHSYLDVLIEVKDIIMSIRDETATWGAEIQLPVGTVEYAFTFTGVRFRSRVAANPGNYWVTVMR